MKITYSEHSYYEELISSSPFLLDLGACLGNFSKHFMEKYPTCKAVLVEPCVTNFGKIEADSFFNGATKIWKAASDVDDQVLVFHEDRNSEQNGSYLFNYFGGHPYVVTTVSLETLLKDVEKVGLVKMDIEGAEWDILENLDESLAKKITQLSVEFHDFIDPSLKKRTERCVQRMLDFGFKLEYNSTNYMHGSQYYDSLFYKWQ
jgi:FkbM family methyltransferase